MHDKQACACTILDTIYYGLLLLAEEDEEGSILKEERMRERPTALLIDR
jgi:hypothetical protein